MFETATPASLEAGVILCRDDQFPDDGPAKGCCRRSRGRQWGRQISR